MKKSTLLAVALCATISFLTGCSTMEKFSYPADEDNLTVIKNSSVSNKTLAIAPFNDARPNENDSNSLLVALVPLVPYGWCEFDRPEKAKDFLTIRSFEFDASKDLTNAAAISLRKSKLFKNIYVNSELKTHKADYLLKGVILSTKYIGNMYTYGLGPGGSVLYFVGFPIGSSENILVLQLYLHDKNGKIIWEYRFDENQHFLQGILFYLGDDTSGFAELMEEAMNKAIKGMNKKLNTK